MGAVLCHRHGLRHPGPTMRCTTTFFARHHAVAAAPEGELLRSARRPSKVVRTRRRLIVEYEVIESNKSAQKLESVVNERMEEGWEPVGGIAVVYAPQSMTWWYYQAMIKKPRDRRRSAARFQSRRRLASDEGQAPEATDDVYRNGVVERPHGRT